MKPKTSKLDRLYGSHLKLLRAFRNQTTEIGHLRRHILEMRAMYGPNFSYDFYRGYRDGLMREKVQ